MHRIALHRTRPDVLFMQKHWDVMRSDNAGDTWHEVSGNLPTDFGFVIDVHAHEPETIYVVPIKSDSEHFPPDGKLRVYRSRTGGNEWEALTKGLPQSDCYVNVLRDAMAVDSLDPCGVYFGTTGGQVYASANAGDRWAPIVRDLPAVLSVEVQTLPMIRVELPHHLRALARVTGEVELDSPAPSRSDRCSMRSRRRTRCCAARSATTAPRKGDPLSGSSRASGTCRCRAGTSLPQHHQRAVGSALRSRARRQDHLTPGASSRAHRHLRRGGNEQFIG